jgi:OmpA-OmpF porin, OOP family
MGKAPRVIWSMLVVLIAVVGRPAHAADCNPWEPALRVAESAGDADKAAALFSDAENSQACSGEELRHLGRTAALAFYRKAYVQQLAAAEQDSLLREGMKFGRPWQLTASVGDLEHAAGKFEEAARLYQEALDDIRDAVANPKPPPAEMIAAIVKKAEEALLLSNVYVKRVDRNGAPSGLACPIFRGFEVKKTALPIEFVYRETTFTPKGQDAANDLVDYLTRQGSPAVHLIGHTDPRGSDEFNQKLSEQRALAVADFLRRKGYGGAITNSGRGKSERFQVDDPGRYSEEQLNQLDRRVELDRKSGGTGCAAASQ